MSGSSQLLTWTRGPAHAAPMLWLHDRYGDPARAPVPAWPRDLRAITVRSPRLQMIGVLSLGYFWFLGPLERPELATFGDGLAQLERLLLTVCPDHGMHRAWLAGHGEGGTLALTLASLWPERVAGAISIDGPLPANLDSMPVQPQPLSGLPILLVEKDRALLRTCRTLQAHGGTVEHQAIQGDPLQAARTWLHAQLAPPPGALAARQGPPDRMVAPAPGKRATIAAHRFNDLRAAPRVPAKSAARDCNAEREGVIQHDEGASR